MDEQNLFNMAVGTLATVGGWWLRVMYQSLNELRTQDTKLADKVSAIEILVAGQYVKRHDMDRSIAALFTKLDRIEDKLDSKVDK